MKNEKTDIRQYRPPDCKEITELFYGTVHRVNSADYTKEQLEEQVSSGALQYCRR